MGTIKFEFRLAFDVCLSSKKNLPQSSHYIPKILSHTTHHVVRDRDEAQNHTGQYNRQTVKPNELNANNRELRHEKTARSCHHQIERIVCRDA